MNIIGILGESINLVFGFARVLSFLALSVFGIEDKRAEEMTDKWMKG